MSGLGICYELIGNSRQCKSKDVMNAEFAFLKSQGYTKVRVYDIGCPLGDVAAAAGAQGLALIAGINTIGNVAGDIGTLIAMLQGNWGVVDTIVVGNEVVNGNSAMVGAVVAAIGTARTLLAAAKFSGHVVTVDTFISHSNHPELCATSDYCAVNAHAFFDTNTSAGQAGDFVLTTAIGMVQKVANGKPIVITESGWPHKGSTNGAAVPSVQNQQSAIASLKSKVAGSGFGLFLFQAYDATYKQPGSLGVEQYFGIYSD
jgi:exo-beta-1,3-glucanase (GH17 family)